MRRIGYLMLCWVALCAVSLCAVSISPVWAENNWFASLYAGQYSNNALNQILRAQTEFEPSFVYVLSVGKGLHTFRKHLGLELEGQLGLHSGIQSHAETNLVFSLRWLTFPWDRYLDTSFAFGNGLSYAFHPPKLEEIENDEGKTNNLLYYLLFELSAQVPKSSHWDMFIRIHHRSSAWKTVGGYFTGSNFVGVGLRYKFN